MMHPRGKLQQGLTVLESLSASVVLAICVFALAMPFTAAVRNDQVQQRRTVAAALTQEMMEEVLARPFSDPQGQSDPGPETGESSRALFDNIDDYHSYDEAAGSVADFTGRVISDAAAAGLSRHVTAEYVYVTGQPTDEPATFIRVIVAMRHEGRPLLTLTRLVHSLE